MKILQVNKYHYSRGGADKYYLDLSEGLKALGHEVANFSMQHPDNIPNDFSKYWPSRLSFNAKLGFKNTLKIPGRVIYSFSVRRRFKKLLKDFKPEIIHIHNIYHHLSPSILKAATKAKIPVVMHLHDYKLICPNHMLFNKGEICERCLGHKYFNCFKYKCVKNSQSASFLASLEMFIHHKVWKIYEKNIRLFIAPSIFMKDICIRFGQDASKIKVIYNPFSSDLKSLKEELSLENKDDNYLLYFGRLSREKGLSLLINSLAATNEKLKIVGRGEELEDLKIRAEKLKAPVEFLDFKSGEELKNIILGAKAIVMPSIWYENMPLSLLEAMSLGKPVIASRVGGFPEIIEDGVNGFLFDMGDFRDLASKINALNNYDLKVVGEAARNSVANLSPENNLQEIISLYKKVLNY